MSEEVKNESVETVAVEAKAEVKKEAKKAPRKNNGKKRGPRQGGKPAAKKPEVFSDSIGDLFPDLAAKLQKSRDERIKQQMKAAQADPKVQAASKKFASEK